MDLYGENMEIDCHCHIFNNDCIPVAGMLASRFGVAVGKQALKLVDDLKSGKIERPLQDYFRDVSIYPRALLGFLDNSQEKDSLLSILGHLDDFFSFLKIGAMDIPQILQKMKQGAPGVDIWVPLMMDMTHAYPGSQPAFNFESQKEIMTRLTLESKGRIMPFFAFDPRSGPPDPVEHLKTVLESQGFVGVKLYPPLGFKPIGNDNPEVEDALMRLYDYCCRNTENPIPITAHCSWSAGVFSNEHVSGVIDIKAYYRNMAHPSHWEEVLKRFPHLKLNMAHFGGLGEWEARAKGTPPHENWVDPIITLIKRHNNVYTDLSFHGLPTTALADDYKRIVLEKAKGIENRLLLGSDWYMSRMQCSLKDYWQGFERLLHDLFGKMTEENAISFLQSDATTTFFPEFFSSHNSELFDRYQSTFSIA